MTALSFDIVSVNHGTRCGWVPLTCSRLPGGFNLRTLADIIAVACVLQRKGQKRERGSGGMSVSNTRQEENDVAKQ